MMRMVAYGMLAFAVALAAPAAADLAGVEIGGILPFQDAQAACVNLEGAVNLRQCVSVSPSP